MEEDVATCTERNEGTPPILVERGTTGCREGGEGGVVLYYKYVPVPDVSAAKEWFLALCSRLRLVGRVRIASEGINVTLGGSMPALREHVRAVDGHPLFHGCSFKLAAAPPGASNPLVAEECGFCQLSVRAVQELVTLGAPTPCLLSDAGPHISPSDFHALLRDCRPAPKGPLAEQKDAAGRPSDGPTASGCPVRADVDGSASSACMGPRPEPPLLLLDVRNLYETRIGRFRAAAGLEVLAPPGIRQFSDLPAWLDAHAGALCNRRVVMWRALRAGVRLPAGEGAGLPGCLPARGRHPAVLGGVPRRRPLRRQELCVRSQDSCVKHERVRGRPMLELRGGVR